MGDAAKSETHTSLRADARRNEARVLDGAHEAFARHGFDASYHDIARIAGVGVGTVYRRFPHRGALVEAVLLDILTDLTGEALAAATDADEGTGFDRFFRALADRMRRHAGLSSQAGVESSATVEAARARLLDAVDQLCRHAAFYLREGLGWRDVILLAQLSRGDGCGLGMEATEERRQLAVTIILDGMRRTSSR